jgi:hypothetical protein
MSITYDVTAVAQPARGTTRSAEPLKTTGARRGAAFSGVTGAVLGTATGVVLGVGSAGLVPAVGAAVFIAMGVLFGAFNGGLIGLLSRLDGR